MKASREITQAECPWLDAEIKQGTTLYPYRKCTYGCVGDGMAISLTGEDREPFFEVPRDAITN